jgi:hypothetical protein
VSPLVRHSLAGMGPHGPWAATVTDAEATRAMDGEVAIITASDILVVNVARVLYQVSGDASCAHDCSSPWKSGDPWPVPVSVPTPTPYDTLNLDARPILAGLTIGPIAGALLPAFLSGFAAFQGVGDPRPRSIGKRDQESTSESLSTRPECDSGLLRGRCQKLPLFQNHISQILLC